MPENGNNDHPLGFTSVMETEPWISIATNEELHDWSSDDTIKYNQVNRQFEKYRFFRMAFDFVSENNVNGDYYEFGCHRCRTFRMALTEARRQQLDKMKFHAFDSFEGLPKPTSEIVNDNWKRGALTTSESEFRDIIKSHGLYENNVTTIKGYYTDTLKTPLQREFLETGRKISIVTIDCDLYESAVPVFEFIDPLLQEGSVIFVDDLFSGYRGNPQKGISKAFLEWQRRSRWKVTRHLDVGWGGRSYVVFLDNNHVDGVL